MKVCAAPLALLALAALAGAVVAADDHVTVDVEGQSLLRTLPERFLSVTLDASLVTHRFKEGAFNLTGDRVLKLARALGNDSTLRLGGTTGDYLLYDMSTSRKKAANPRPTYTMHTDLWQDVNEFASASGFPMVFGLNGRLHRRDVNGPWSASNALPLIQRTRAMQYPVFAFELGNEPDLWHKHGNVTVSPEQLASDFKLLKKVFENEAAAAAAAAAVPAVAAPAPAAYQLIGPDTAGGLERGGFLERFLSALGDGIVDAVTWHQYYGNGRTAVLRDFVAVKTLDKLLDQLNRTSAYVRRYAPSAEVWLGETSSMYGGGAPGLSDRFVAGFLWLDKLGLAALLGQSKVCRQAFFGGSYSLVNDSLLPNPDFFTAVLFQRLVGRGVLAVAGAAAKGRSVRSYAFCTRHAPGVPSGAVTLLVLNLEASVRSIRLAFSGQAAAPLHDAVAGAAMAPRQEYHLSAEHAGVLDSASMRLNGDLLKVSSDGDLPDMSPKLVDMASDVTMEPYSMSFIVVPSAAVLACRTV